MQEFINTADNTQWAFNDDVVVTENAGVYTFTAPHGAVLNVPSTLVPGTLPSPVVLSQQAALAAVNGVNLILNGSVTLASSFFPTDPTAQLKMQGMAALARAGTPPTGCTTYDLKGQNVWLHLTASQYLTVVAAIGDYVAVCNLIADGNPNAPTSLPSSTLTITLGA